MNRRSAKAPYPAVARARAGLDARHHVLPTPPAASPPRVLAPPTSMRREHLLKRLHVTGHSP